jgi:hypothetical protein
VYFSTVVRGERLDRSGDYVALDWSTKQVLASVPAVPATADRDDPNPRGGRRGGRGLWVDGDQVLAATDDRIFVFDRALGLLRTLSNGLLVGVHELYQETPGRLWAAATTLDAAVEVDLADGSVTDTRWPREDARLQAELGLVPLPVDKTADNKMAFLTHHVHEDAGHAHLNAVAAWKGELLGLFCRMGVVVNLDRGEMVFRHPLLVRSHNLVVVDDTVFVSGTRNRQVCQFELPTGRLIRTVRLAELPWVRGHIDVSDLDRRTRLQALAARRRGQSDALARSLFVRGLQVRGDLVFAGVSPATILCLDWRTGRLVDAYQHSDRVTCAVHGLQVAEPVAG